MIARFVVGALALMALVSCASKPADGSFATPEEAVRVLTETVKGGDLDALVKLFGAEGRELVSGSDPQTGRQNQQVFLAAIAEQSRLEDRGADTKELVIGNEDWPFPIPLVMRDGRWRFDGTAGREEVLARRIGRNELRAIDVCMLYVAAQKSYAQEPHDGKKAGPFAQRINSEPGRHNGLYWPPVHGQPRSPIGDFVAAASLDGYELGSRAEPAPFHGYQFRILTAQGPAAPGGAKDYLVKGELTGGFALIAWPSQYDSSGVMTFIVNADGVVHERDLGPETPAAVAAITHYDPDSNWQPLTTPAAR